MTVNLFYGKERTQVKIPRGKNFSCIEVQRKSSASESPQDIVQSALRNSRVSLSQFVKPVDTVALVVSDYSRPTGSHIYTPAIVEHLLNSGVDKNNIVIVISLGLHRPAGEEEKRSIVGNWVYENIRIENHDPDKNLVYVRGTGFNKTVMESDKVLLSGVVTFHPMAGYSGGYKSILPGVASREAIIRNHKKYFKNGKTHPFVGSGIVENNPIQEDIAARCKGIKPMYCLNAVLNDNKEIAFASAGKVYDAWKKCTEYVREHNSVVIDTHYDLLIASAGGYPSDFSFYQCMKVLINASRAVDDGGVLIILAECSAGWEISSELFSWFLLPLEEIAAKLKTSFRMDGLAVYMASKVISTYKVYLLSSLPEEEVERIGINALKNVNEIEKIVEKNAESRKIGVMPFAGQTLPVVKKTVSNEKE